MSEEHPSGYVIKLSWRMLVAIVDIANRTHSPVSPSNHRGTLKALDARGLIIWNPDNPTGSKRLTALGKDYLAVAKKEAVATFKAWEAEFEEAA